MADQVETCAQFIGPNGRRFLIQILRARGRLLVEAGCPESEPVRVSEQLTVAAAREVAARWAEEFRRSQVLRETAIDPGDGVAPADPNALYWSRRGEIACGEHAPRHDNARWVADRWTAIDERAVERRIHYQCAICHGSPVRHLPRTRQPSGATA